MNVETSQFPWIFLNLCRLSKATGGNRRRLAESWVFAYNAGHGHNAPIETPIMKPLIIAALFIASFYGSTKAWKRLLPAFHGITRGLLAFITGAALLAGVDVAYYQPRNGGYIGYLTEGWVAGSDTEALEAELGRAQFALSIYYGDTNGKYPETLDVLWKEQKYLPRPLRRAEVYAEFPGRGIARAHWYRDTARIKIFESAKDSDDSGGWGYVNDPKSPEYGAVFVNCTHVNFRKNVPWNLIRQQRSAAPAAPPAAAERLQAAVRTMIDTGFQGAVTSNGAKATDVEIIFTNEDGTRNYQTRSDAAGRYRVELPPGRYKVATAHPRYKPYVMPQGYFVVLPGIRGTGNLVLQPL